MNIEFTKKQYKTLLKLVYLGNWMANAYRTEDFEKDMQEVEEYVFSFAKDFGLESFADAKTVGDGKYYPTMKFMKETKVHNLHEDYDEETFWEKLIDCFGKRDCVRKYGHQIKKMSKEELFEKLTECEDYWCDEINEYGIQRLEIEE